MNGFKWLEGRVEIEEQISNDTSQLTVSHSVSILQDRQYVWRERPDLKQAPFVRCIQFFLCAGCNACYVGDFSTCVSYRRLHLPVNARTQNMFSRDVKRLSFRCQTLKFSRPNVKFYF